ncbi:PEP-CTERM sorting domain-containing protein [Aeoliella sp.]|uniref:PEP-CTERM sorting domain-containing protein n=1 Tax=Aeoliella sp. TaxID=2795800 RepID=UPI003CCBD73A
MKRCVFCLAAVAFVALVNPAFSFNILTPSDFIIAIDTDFEAAVSNENGGEPATNAIDGTLNKYLNFGRINTGFLVTPGSSTVQSMVLTTANDAIERDPASYILQGTNVDPMLGTATPQTPNNGTGNEIDYMWETISQGTLALPDTRDTVAAAIDFANASAYSSYRLYFPDLKNIGTANSMQIAEVQFYSGLGGGGSAILAPTNPIVAIADDTPVPQSSSPPAELPEKAIDRILSTKYLNFAEERSGFILTPSVGATVVDSFSITTGNDAPERDPTSYEIWGTNEAITTPNNGIGNEQNYTLISSGAIEPPVERGVESPTVSFTNTNSYTSYKVVFPTVRDAAIANSMQIAEFSLNAVDVSALVINRSGPNAGTGYIRADEAFSIGSYSIQSLSGLLLPDGWDSITSTNADPADGWTETSSTANELSEEDGQGVGADDGFPLAMGGQLNLGAAFQVVPTFFADGTTPTNWEDAIFTLFDENGDIIGGLTEFVGDPVPWGDYNGDLVVNAADWPLFRAGLGGDYSELSQLDAYLNGDLDGDLDSDLDDFHIFVDLAGGAAALFGASQVPEPSTIGILAIGGLMLCGTRRFRGIAAAMFTVLLVAMGSNSQAQSMQNFSIVQGSNNPPVTSIPAGQENENETSTPAEFFDDTILDDPGQIPFDLFATDYNDPELFPTGPPNQYAGLGADPKVVFFDYGTSVSANWFMYAQRSGGDPTADRVGKFEFWFSNSDFAGTLPGTDPDSVVDILPNDSRLVDSTLRPYSLSGDRTGRYVAMRLTVSELSAGQPVNNIGGHEFRLLNGPSDVVLDVDRGTGELTLRNNLAGAENIFMKGYSIESPGGGLDALSFDGVGGDSVFTLGDGSGNGWEIAGGSDESRLIEAFFSGETTFTAGTGPVSLGNAYNNLSGLEDLIFKWTNSQGETYNGRVEYSGVAPVLTGDYNGDGTVNIADYTVWRNNLGGTAVLPGDTTPGSVTAADFDVWKANFGASSGAIGGVAAANVPEPSTALLVLLGASTALLKLRRFSV